MSRAGELVERARELYRRGAVADALAACEQAAEEARRTDDLAALADAATVIRVGHARQRRRAACTSSAWTRWRGSARATRCARPGCAPSSSPPATRSARPSRSTCHPRATTPRRPSCGSRPGTPHASPSSTCPSGSPSRTRRSSSAGGPAPTSTPRGDAAGGWTPTPCWATASTWSPRLNALRPLVARLDQPAWTAYLLLVDASQRLLEGRYDDALAAGRRARGARPARARPASSTSSSPRPSRCRRAVRLAGADRARCGRWSTACPYLAGGWLCMMLQGRRPARGGRGPLAGARPARAPLPRPRAGVGDRCRRATRRSAPGSATPRRHGSIYDQLAPYSGLHAIGLAAHAVRRPGRPRARAARRDVRRRRPGSLAPDGGAPRVRGDARDALPGPRPRRAR